MQVFRDYRLIECETTMRRLTPIAIREVAVFDTEDVAPVVHAHWETDNYGYAILNEDGDTLYLAGVPCSRCYVTGHTNWNYCPNCGAIMDEEVE